MKGLVKVIPVFLFCVFLLMTVCRMPASAAMVYDQVYSSPGGESKVLVLVNSAIYAAISEGGLKQYVADLEAEGYNVVLTSCTSGTAEEIKNYFKTLSGLKGVVFIGNLAVPQFEIANDFSTYGYASFPIDLFYMDLNGEWVDTDSNGIYDVYNPSPATAGGAGDLKPEIWVSRLTAGTVKVTTMDEVALLKNYFAKNHAYRLGQTSILSRALAYPDDDWYYFNDTGLKKAYQDVTIINDIEATIASDYKLRLKENYEWIGLCAHSNPTVHVFKNTAGTGGSVSYSDIQTIDPSALFYNLFACSNARYTSTNYMGGHYVFAKTNGLAAVGSTKTGSMLSFEYFYDPLGQLYRKNLGEAFKTWFSTVDLTSPSYKSWFYGMTLIGDGTLTLAPSVASIVSINPASAEVGEKVSFNGSAKITSGEIAGYSWRSSINGYLGGTAAISTSALSEGTHTIYFKVKDTKGRWSSEAQATFVVSPAVLSGLEATVSDTNVVFKWPDNYSNESGFVLESSTDNVTFQTMVQLAANATTFTLDGLPSEKMYFRVFAFNSAVKFPNSNVVLVDPFPQAPSGLTATVSASNIVFKWLDNSTNESGFLLQSSTDNVTFQTMVELAANATTFTLDGLPSEKMYFRIFAFNTRLQSGYSNVVSADPFPQAPSGLTATVSASNIVFKWLDNSTNESGFLLQSSADNVTFQTMVELAANATTFTLDGLPSEKMYFRIFAFNTRLQSGYSNVVSVDPLSKAPSNLTAAVSATNVVFNWTDNSNNESGFVLESSRDNATYYTVTQLGPNITTFTLNNLPPDKFYYRIYSYNSIGKSGFSNPVLVDPFTKAPSNLTAAVGGTNVVFNWTDNSTNESGFYLQSSRDNVTYSTVAQLGPNITTFTLNNLPTEKYYYRIYSYNSIGISGFSNVVSVDPLPQAPTYLAASPASSAQIKLSWQDNAANEAGFLVERKTSKTAFVQIATLGPNIKTFNDIKLKAKTTYSYRVRAYNSSGFSSYSNVAQATAVR